MDNLLGFAAHRGGGCVRVNAIQRLRMRHLEVHHSRPGDAVLFPVADRWHAHIEQARHLGGVAQRLDDFGCVWVHGRNCQAKLT